MHRRLSIYLSTDVDGSPFGHGAQSPPVRKTSSLRKWALRLAGGGLAVLLAIQLVPYGRRHSNPPVSGEPRWDSPRTERLTRDACYDCHSNETEWPWYSNVAPASWLLQRDVDGGRAELNFSEFDREQKEAEDSAETIVDGEMPPLRYLPLHPEARLSPGEKNALVRGLRTTLGIEDE
jgi:Haem-binding domain